MDERPPKDRSGREERIRELGFNPSFLTPQEQMDLLEIHAAAPDRHRAAEPRRPVLRYS